MTGRIATDSHLEKLQQHFAKHGWILRDENWLKQGLEKLSSSRYKNDIATIVAKLAAMEAPETRIKSESRGLK